MTDNVAVYEALAESYRATWPHHRDPMHYCLAPFATYIRETFPDAVPRILDVGSGAGFHTASMVRSGFVAVAIDAAPSMLQVVRDNVPEAVCVVADFWTYDPPMKFQGVIAASFIHLFPKADLKTVLDRLAAWLMPGGAIFIATVPGPSNDGEWLAKEANHGGTKRWRVVYAEKELLAAVAEAGYEVVYRWYDPDPLHDGKVFLNMTLRPKP